MAKALVNRGVPIKADNPKDPYIRDEDSIKDIVDSSTTFGKTLGTDDGKIQLKNGNTVLSEVSVGGTTLYTELSGQVTNVEIEPDGEGGWITFSLWTTMQTSMHYKIFTSQPGLMPIYESITVVNNVNNLTFHIDLSSYSGSPYGYAYVVCTAIDGNTSYAEPDPAFDPSVRTDYTELELGTGLKVEATKLKTDIPAYSSADSGKVLSVDSHGNLAWITLS